MTDDQVRYLEEVKSLWQKVDPLMRRKAAVVGGMQWKTVGGKEYLYRYQPDPITKKKRSTSIGPRSAETEAIYQAFHLSREQVRAEVAEVQPKLETFARLAKALRLNRVPEVVADVMEALHGDGLLEMAPLAGQFALRAFEVRFSKSLEVHHFSGSRDEIQLLVPDEADLVRAMIKAFLRVDPYYRMEEDYVVRGLEGPPIRLTLQSDLIERAADVLPNDHLDLFMSLLEAEPTAVVALSRSGRSVPIIAADPALWAAVYVMDEGHASLARSVMHRQTNLQTEMGDHLDHMVNLLADAPSARGPRI